MSAALASGFTPALVIPPAPTWLPSYHRRAIVHSGELAITKGLALVGRGTCRVAGHEGDPVWAVSSASRPALAHLVWVENGRRIQCDCEARKRGRFTCSHAQFVRLLIVAEHARPASVPAAIIEPAPVAPEDDPDPTPPPTPRGPRGLRCPTCGAPVDQRDLDELGECLQCLQMRADYARADRAEEERRADAEWQRDESERYAAQQLPCWACGEPATAETDHGLYCDACVSLPRPALRRKVAARQKRLDRETREAKEEKTRQRISARAEERGEQAREKAGTPSEASPRADRAPRTEAGRRAAEKAAKRRPAAEPDGYAASFQRAMQSIASLRGEA